MRLSDLVRSCGGDPATLGADPILLVEDDAGIPRAVTAADTSIVYDAGQPTACLTLNATNEDEEG